MVSEEKRKAQNRAAHRRFRENHKNDEVFRQKERDYAKEYYRVKRKPMVDAMTEEERKAYNHKRYMRRREKALEYARTHPHKKKEYSAFLNATRYIKSKILKAKS